MRLNRSAVTRKGSGTACPGSDSVRIGASDPWPGHRSAPSAAPDACRVGLRSAASVGMAVPDPPQACNYSRVTIFCSRVTVTRPGRVVTSRVNLHLGRPIRFPSHGPVRGRSGHGPRRTQRPSPALPLPIPLEACSSPSPSPSPTDFPSPSPSPTPALALSFLC
jgi:hypothetical protein